MNADASLDQAILAHIREVVPARFKKVAITRDMRLQRDLGLDSLGIASLLFRLEGEFGLDLMGDPEMPARMRGLRSVEDLIAFARGLRR